MNTRLVLVAVAASGIVLVGGSSIYSRRRREVDAMELAKQAALAKQEADLHDVMEQLKRERLEDEECSALTAKNLEAGLPVPACVEAIRKREHARGRPIEGTQIPRNKDRPPCNCQPGDPLCSCL